MSECVKYRSLLTGRITTTSIDESKEECIQYANDRSSTLIKEPPMENRMPYNTMIGTRNENNRRHVSSDGNGYLRPRLGGRKGERNRSNEVRRINKKRQRESYTTRTQLSHKGNRILPKRMSNTGITKITTFQSTPTGTPRRASVQSSRPMSGVHNHPSPGRTRKTKIVTKTEANRRNRKNRMMGDN